MAEQTPTTTETETPAPLTTFTYRGEEYKVTRKPSAFLLASLGNVDSGDPAALGVIVDFFKRVLPADEFLRFRNSALDDDAEVEDGFTALAEALQKVVTDVMARPTK